MDVGKSIEVSKDTPNKIAEYWGTKNYLNSNSLDDDIFNKISDTIEKTFILKYK